MNIQQMAEIMTILETAYPRFYVNKTADEKQVALDIWTMMFADDHSKIVTEAVKSMICTLKFPPTIADVKEKIALITQPTTNTELEAWGKVLKALQNSTYHAEEEFENLSANIKKLIGSPNQLREWAMMESDIVNSVIQSNFMRSYKVNTANEKDLSMLPESTKQLQKNLSENIGKNLITGRG